MDLHAELDILNVGVLRNAVLQAASAVLTTLNGDLMSFSTVASLGQTEKDITDLTKEIDVKALALIQGQLRSHLPGTKALVCSEENPLGELLIHDQFELPDLLFIVDPIDNTDGATHGGAAFTAITVYSRSKASILAAAVGDFARNEIYYADNEIGAQLFAPGEFTQGRAMRPNGRAELEGAYFAAYTLKPGRFIETAKASAFLKGLGDAGRVDCLGGSASLSRVAAGYIDGAVEFVKGFQVYDLFPGAFILTKAGGTCWEIGTGKALRLTINVKYRKDLDTELKKRQRFVAAASTQLYAQAVAALSADGIR